LTLPGWGGWSGAGIDPNDIKKRQNKSRRRRGRKSLIIQPKDVIKNVEEREKLMKRQDSDLPHVIISEKKDGKIAAFQV
jgi:U3 small nucleolar RNA-associated protein 14